MEQKYRILIKRSSNINAKDIYGTASLFKRLEDAALHFYDKWFSFGKLVLITDSQFYLVVKNMNKHEKKKEKKQLFWTKEQFVEKLENKSTKLMEKGIIYSPCREDVDIFI